MGKAFEKQIKTTEDQGQKQVEAAENLKPKEQTATADTSDDDEPLKQKEACNKIFDEKLNEIQEMRKEIDYKNLVYNFTSKTSGSINSIKFKGPFGIFKEIKEGNISLKITEKDQEKFKRELGQVKSGNPKQKSQKQLHTIKNVQYLYDFRQRNIDLFNDYSKIKSESIY